MEKEKTDWWEEEEEEKGLAESDQNKTLIIIYLIFLYLQFAPQTHQSIPLSLSSLMHLCHIN